MKNFRIQLPKGQPQRIEWLSQHVKNLGELVPPFVSWRFGPQDPYSCLQSIDTTLQFRLPKRHGFDTNLVNQPLQLTRSECNTEKLYRKIRNLVRLVENDGLRAREELDKTLFLHREICEQQMMIDDDEVSFLR